MKTFILSVGIAFLVSAPFTYADAPRQRIQDPCFNVNIQHDSVNTSNVRQSCDRNVNRTVQVGRENRARTIQTGQVNDNKTIQYHYDRSKYLERLRRK